MKRERERERGITNESFQLHWNGRKSGQKGNYQLQDMGMHMDVSSFFLSYFSFHISYFRHSAVCSPNFMYICGGKGANQYFSDVILFDFAAKEFHFPSAHGNQRFSPRAHPSAAWDDVTQTFVITGGKNGMFGGKRVRDVFCFFFCWF